MSKRRRLVALALAIPTSFMGLLWCSRASGQSCPSGYKYDEKSQSCSGSLIGGAGGICLPGYGKSGASSCVGPPFDCPGKSGYIRVFKKDNPEDTLCTNADLINIDDKGGCPSGFYATPVAHRPYWTVCVGQTPPPTTESPEEKRIHFASLQAGNDHRLEPGNGWIFTADGANHDVLVIHAPNWTAQDVDGLFHSGMRYGQDLWGQGFKATVLTDGERYWIGSLSRKWYTGSYGPFDRLPTLKEIASYEAANAQNDAFEANAAGYNDEPLEYIVTVRNRYPVRVLDRDGEIANRDMLTVRLNYRDGHNEWRQLICLHKQLGNSGNGREMQDTCDSFVPGKRYRFGGMPPGVGMDFQPSKALFPRSVFQVWAGCKGTAAVCETAAGWLPIGRYPITAIREPDGTVEH